MVLIFAALHVGVAQTQLPAFTEVNKTTTTSNRNAPTITHMPDDLYSALELIVK